MTTDSKQSAKMKRTEHTLLGTITLINAQ